MADLTFNITGVRELKAALQRLAAEIPQDVARAMYEEAHVERLESMRRTPVDTGALKGSHEVHAPKFGLRDITVDITVGGPSAPYALFVHEDLEAFHKSGQAKFLESTILESAPYMAARIARRVLLSRAI